MNVFNAYNEAAVNGEKFQRLSDDIRNGRVIFMREQVVQLFTKFGNDQLHQKNIRHYDLRTIYADPLCPGEDTDLGGKPVWNFDVPEIIYPVGRPKGISPELPVEQDEKWSIQHAMWMDSSHGMTITYKGYPQVIMSFRPNQFDGDILRITQLQGVTYNNTRTYKKDGRLVVDRIGPAFRSQGISALDWTCLLLDSAEEIARRYQMTGVEIQRAENNASAHLFSAERGHAIYNDPANWMGYLAIDDTSDFLKKL